MIDVKNLTPEQLMQLAKGELTVNKAPDLPEVQRFIHSEGLRQGDYPISAMLIYDRYRQWSTTFDTKTMSVRAFFTDFKSYFKKKPSAKGSFYCLSPEGFNLSAEYLDALKRKRISIESRKKKIKQREKSVQAEEQRKARSLESGQGTED